MVHAARALGLGVMLGCMVESGLGIAAGAQIASLCDHVDLDGNLLLAEDPWPGVEFRDGVQLPADAPGLGVGAAMSVDCLLASPEPAVRLLTLTEVLGEQPGRKEQAAVAESPLVQALSLDHGVHPYAKWQGAQWRMIALTELGVPPRHEGARRAADQALDWLDTPAHRKHRVIGGLVRRCASMEGNGLWAATRLGLVKDARVRRLVDTLVESQWPDGGWNCDRKLKATHSSFHESFAPVTGLAAYAHATGDERAEAAAARGAGFFLRHHVFCSERTGERWPKLEVLRYPPYWHYDALAGLTMLRRSVGLGDPRVEPALTLLEAKRRPDGTWRTEGKWWKPPGRAGGNVESVAWNGTAHELLSVRALAALAAAGRL